MSTHSFTGVYVLNYLCVCVCLRAHLFSCQINEGAAFLEVQSDVSFREVQDVERLINHLIWEQVCDSVSHI